MTRFTQTDKITSPVSGEESGPIRTYPFIIFACHDDCPEVEFLLRNRAKIRCLKQINRRFQIRGCHQQSSFNDLLIFFSPMCNSDTAYAVSNQNHWREIKSGNCPIDCADPIFTIRSIPILLLNPDKIGPRVFKKCLPMLRSWITQTRDDQIVCHSK